MAPQAAAAREPRSRPSTTGKATSNTSPRQTGREQSKHLLRQPCGLAPCYTAWCLGPGGVNCLTLCQNTALRNLPLSETQSLILLSGHRREEILRLLEGGGTQQRRMPGETCSWDTAPECQSPQGHRSALCQPRSLLRNELAPAGCPLLCNRRGLSEAMVTLGATIQFSSFLDQYDDLPCGLLFKRVRPEGNIFISVSKEVEEWALGLYR